MARSRNNAARAVVAGLALAWPVLSGAQPPGKPEEALDKSLIARQSPHWLKTYSLSPYTEYWTVTLTVRDLNKALPKILKVYENDGAALTQPLQNFPASAQGKSQQLSYRLSLKSAKDSLKKLKKIGAMPPPIIRQGEEETSLPEVKDKIERLMDERTAHNKELSSMPITSAVIDEMLEHLLLVEAIREKHDVLLNMTIQEGR